jgi:hypothetical protein
MSNAGGAVKSPIQFRKGDASRTVAHAVLPLIASLVAAFAAAPAHAVLGGAPMTTPSGATANRAVAKTAAVPGASSASGASASAAATGASYSVRSTTLGNGTIVNEYVSADGTVFGVAWRGERIPDLPGLLGSYFPQYLQGLKAQRAARASRGPVSVQDSGLVVHSGGHMGSFAGQAYLPEKLPAGVSGSDIQ